MSVNLSFIGGAGWQFFADNGRPLAGGFIYTYAAGTTTPLDTYTDRTGNTANANPIELDSAGRTPSQIWSTEGLLYKYVVKTSVGVEIRSWDNIGGSVVASDLATNLAASSGSSLIGFLQAGTGAVATTVQAKLRESISVKDFGATGDGVTNDTAAFVAASAAITANDGGHLIIPAGTYIVGSQTFAGATGAGYSYLGARVINIRNCNKSLVVEFQGAILKLAAGLKFGSFDPVTGGVYNPGALPFTNPDYAADVGCMIDLESNKNVAVIGSVELDGNQANLTLGGYWGDVGRQCVGYGFFAFFNENLYAQNVYSHHHALDGACVGDNQLVAATAHPVTLDNFVCEYNARQGLTHAGGIGATINNSKFNHSGKATFSSAPSAGIDIEPDTGVSRRVVFNNCEAINNTGLGVVLDSGDVADITFNDCRIIGTTFYSIWPRMPQVTFNRCLIVGSFVNTYGSSTDPELATKFSGCRITDFTTYGYGGATYAPGLLIDTSGVNVLFEDCTIEAGRQKLGSILSANLSNTTMMQYAGTNVGIVDQDWVLLLNGSKFNNLVVRDLVSSTPANAYYIGLDGTEVYYGNNYLYSTGKILWFNWNPAAGGSYGALGQNNGSLAPNTYLAVGKSTGNRLIGFYGQLKVVAGPASPAGGSDTWGVGDRCINSVPATFSPTGWICTVAGTPGTWIEEGTAGGTVVDTWTPADASGAGLVFTSVIATYTKIGKLVTAFATLTYPATADGSSAAISGLPFASNPSGPQIVGSVSYTTASTAQLMYISGSPGATQVSLLTPGANVLNSTMTSKALIFMCTYLTA
jgi:hypothetical protein